MEADVVERPVSNSTERKRGDPAPASLGQHPVGDDPAQQIERAYRLTICRSPTEAELATMRQFLTTEAETQSADAARRNEPLSPNDARRRALEQLCRVILNLNEFLYPN